MGVVYAGERNQNVVRTIHASKRFYVRKASVGNEKRVRVYMYAVGVGGKKRSTSLHVLREV